MQKNMVAAMGLTVKNGAFNSAFIQTMLIIYKKCFLPKILYGLSSFKITKSEEEKFDIEIRSILSNFGNLPQGTSKAALMNELGIWPIHFEIMKRKLMMWQRINREESNNLIKETMKEQIINNLPWFSQLLELAAEIEIDLRKAKVMSKNSWKRLVMIKINKKIKNQLIEYA